MSRIAVRWGIVLGLVVVLASAGHARATGEVAVQVSIRPVDTVVIGDAATVVVDLRRGGAALVDEPVELSVDGTYYRRERTAAGGSASFALPKDLVAGTHRLTAIYPGRTNSYLPASTSATFEVAPYELTVQTVPALPGMGFTLDGEPFEADAAGIASIPVSTAGDHVLAALASDYHVGGRQTQFARWSVNDEYASQVTVNVPKDGAVQAGFDVYQPASQVFVDPSGGAVEADRITSFTVRSSLGQVLTFPDGSERLYKASRVVRRSSGLESVDIRYNVTDVQVDGSNVVNAGQQQFYVTSNATWRISLLLFSARIQPKDALLGFTAGTSVEVIYPSGKSEVVKAGDDGVVVIPWLARGIYRVAVADAPGWAPAMPVALSRDQEVELRVVSYLDMGIAVFVAFGVIFGLLHRGRPHLIPKTVRAVGDGVTGIRLPMPGVVRPPARQVAATAASPPEQVATPAQSAEHRAPVKVEAAPILATIGRRADLGEFSKAPLTQGRQASSTEPMMDALAQFAPALLGLPQPNAATQPPDEVASSRTGKDTMPAVAKDGSAEPAAARRSRPRTVGAAGAAAKAAADATGTDSTAVTASVAEATEASRTGRAAAATAKRRSKKAAAGPDAGSPETEPRRTRRSDSAATTDTAATPSKAKRSRSRAASKEALATPTTGENEPKRSRRRSNAASEPATADSAIAPKKRGTTRASTAKRKDAAVASGRTAPAEAKASATKTAARRTKAAKANNAAPAEDASATKARGTGAKSRARSAKATEPAGTTKAKRTRAPRAVKGAGEAAPAGAPAEKATPTAVTTPRTGRIFRSAHPAPISRTAQVGRLEIPDSRRSPSAVPKKPVDEPPVMQACANCGLELWVGARFCRRCGQPTAEALAEAVPEMPTATSNGRAPRRGGRRAADPALATPPPAGTTRTRPSRRGGE